MSQDTTHQAVSELKAAPAVADPETAHPESMSSEASGAQPSVLVIQPDEAADLAQFAGWLEDAAVTVRVIRPYSGEPLPREVAEDSLIVLGGHMNAYADERAPWLEDVRSLIRDAADKEIPTLGICLGGQLIAATMGGSVKVSAPQGLESGAVEVSWTDAAADDAVFGGLPNDFISAAFHSDGIDVLPPGAVLLGTGVDYAHQAFRIGSAWGVQFHPEAGLARFREWCIEDLAENPDRSAAFESQIAAFEQVEARMRAGSRQLADQFLEVVHATRQARIRVTQS
ncbi:MAG: type 1 glutamine amidotransferase [Gulosibacter sp.]|uniref:type 1 glutamine amidotransferase n=1 Tax=Gulosibacter sp. TaxID=2817531 RepID=UPI003F8EFC9D